MEHLLSQCFLNYMDWAEIDWFLRMTLCCTVVDLTEWFCFPALYFLAILQHVEAPLYEHALQQTVLSFIFDLEFMKGFHVLDHFSWICKLARKHHDRLSVSVNATDVKSPEDVQDLD